jgi:hypothetical protein
LLLIGAGIGYFFFLRNSQRCPDAPKYLSLRQSEVDSLFKAWRFSFKDKDSILIPGPIRWLKPDSVFTRIASKVNIDSLKAVLLASIAEGDSLVVISKLDTAIANRLLIEDELYLMHGELLSWTRRVAVDTTFYEDRGFDIGYKAGRLNMLMNIPKPECVWPFRFVCRKYDTKVDEFVKNMK